MRVSSEHTPCSIPIGAEAAWALPAALAAAIDVHSPELGITCGGDHLLGLDLRSACTANDHWIRGGDVVAVYEPDDPRRLRATALWHRWPCRDAAAWELIASATTSRERTDASLAVASDVAANEILWGGVRGDRLIWQTHDRTGASCVLLRRPHAPPTGSVFLAGHPADTRHVLAERRGERVRVQCWLFSAAAEKGVLFRGRGLAAVGPADGDLAWADRIWHDFVATPPMLTA